MPWFCTTAKAAQPPFGATVQNIMRDRKSDTRMSGDGRSVWLSGQFCIRVKGYRREEGPEISIAALTSKRTNLSPFTKGCRDRGASMRIYPIFSGLLAQQMKIRSVTLRLASVTLRCPKGVRAADNWRKMTKFICSFWGPHGGRNVTLGERNVTLSERCPCG